MSVDKTENSNVELAEASKLLNKNKKNSVADSSLICETSVPQVTKITEVITSSTVLQINTEQAQSLKKTNSSNTLQNSTSNPNLVITTSSHNHTLNPQSLLTAHSSSHHGHHYSRRESFLYRSDSDFDMQTPKALLQRHLQIKEQ